jgi:L-fucose isomerase
VKKNCPEGKDYNDEPHQRPREALDEEWETNVKMTLIARDLMVGNPKLAEMGYGEQAQGHEAIAAGFQGQRQWTDHFPEWRFPRSHPEHFLRLEWQTCPVYRGD